MVENTESGCAGGGCSHCSLDSAPIDGMAGWNLVGKVMLAFLLPLALGIVGAVIWRHDQTTQTLATMGGLLVGFVVALVVQRLSRSSRVGRK